jgi:uncharacterized membrane protein (DUF4010 family)
MAGRIAVIAFLLAPALVPHLAYPLGAFLAISTALGLAAAARGRPMAMEEGRSPLKSPFDLVVVGKLVLVLGGVMAAARILSAVYGAGALLPVAAFAGLADVDAVTLATARMTVTGLDAALGAKAILLAAAVDSVSKIGLAAAFGGVRFGGLFAAGTLLAMAAAAAAYWI